MLPVQLLFQSVQKSEVSHVFTHRGETLCLQTMQLILQNFLSFEDAYEKAQLKNQKIKKQECFFFMANIVFALFDYSILKPSYHDQQIKSISYYKLRL